MSNPKPTSLLEFYNLLERHDWYYAFSDDMRAYDKGKENEDKMLLIASHSQAHQELYDAFLAHYTTGEPWGTERRPKPEKPR